VSFWKYDKEWADGTTDLSVELHCYRYDHDVDEGGLGQVGHMTNAIKTLFPERLPNGRRGCVWHPWLERRVECWCNVTARRLKAPEDWYCWFGPASAGKTADAAVIALVDWLAGYDCTTTIVCSTTIKMLKKRIWGEVLRYYTLYGGQLPGTYQKSSLAILSNPDGEFKNGIHGIAIQQGTVEEAMGDLIGVHNDRVRLIIDEAQATREAAFEATENLSANPDFKLLAMGNPQSHLDPLGRYSEPDLGGGWAAVSPAMPEWPTKYGVTLFFDGRKSPGIQEPKRLSFLLQQKQIEETIARRGEDSPYMWTFRIGFPPPEGLLHTIITESMLVKFHMRDPAVWKYPPQRGAGLDPSFSNGGDRCILAPYEFGELITGEMAILFLPYIHIKLAIAKDKPITYHIQERVQEECEELGIRPSDLGIEVSGTQGSLADVIEREWGPGVHRVKFQGSATNRPVSREDPTPASKAYSNRVTELWFNFSLFARYGQVRGMCLDSAREFTQRLVVEDKQPQQIEPKRAMRARLGISPDIADAQVTALDHLIHRHGILPGEGVDFSPQNEDDFYRDVDVDSKPAYVSEPF